MKKIFINNKQALDLAVAVLQKGGLVMHPTETCYGLAVDIFNEKALKKLYLVKMMDADKPVSILVDSLKMAKEYAVFGEKALALAQKYWPGPLSLVLPRKEKLPEFLNPNEKFISIRLSSFDFCSQMVKKLGRPVTTTSANISGKPQLYAADIGKFGEMTKKIDLVVDGGKIFENEPSTIVKVNGGKLIILRKGWVLSE